MNPTDTPRLTGTQINYLLICPRKLWLFSHHIEMERENDLVALGQLLHEESFQRKKKEVLIDDLIRLDFFDDKAIHDMKKGRSMEEAHRAQLPAFSANNLPAHARETGRKSSPGAGLRVGEGVQSAR